MDDKWLKYLQMLGLTESEVSVYLSALKLGPQPAQNLAKEVGVSRVTVYAAIDALTKQGLMTSVEKGKKQFYAAEPPERIVWLAENKLHDLKNSIDEIKNNIEELKFIQSGDKPIVKLYEGPDAMGALEADVVEANVDVIYELGNRDEVEKLYPIDRDTRENYYETLAKKKSERRLIFVSKDPVPRSVEANKKIKFLDSKKFKFFGDIFFYGDTVWLSSFRDKQMTVMVKSKDIADTFRTAFDLLWDSLP